LFDAHHGLPSVAGGRHPGWGTENRIVPLGDTYLELIAVADEAVASANTFGEWVSSAATPHGRPLGWAVRPDDLDETAARLGLRSQWGERARPDGELVRWRAAGIDEAATQPGVPFFIEWAAQTTFPGAATGDEPTAAVTRLEIETQPERLAAWLGEHALPIRVSTGERGLTRVVLEAATGEIVLESAGEP
jgi:Glyoxalase-like domain